MAEYFDFARVEIVKQVIQFLQEPLGRSVLGNYILFACLFFFYKLECLHPSQRPRENSADLYLSSPGLVTRGPPFFPGSMEQSSQIPENLPLVLELSSLTH